MFSCEINEIFKNNLFEEHLRTTASVNFERQITVQQTQPQQFELQSVFYNQLLYLFLFKDSSEKVSEAKEEAQTAHDAASLAHDKALLNALNAQEKLMKIKEKLEQQGKQLEGETPGKS